ncbi:hypothetical protein MEX01_28990 [Methylorubrum extorquens]|uniref:hypothetical protein n=1 Tax=Methylorubrum extorquens TaxID=408 RepID=UPI00117498F3|nr:hypothetical protein [Methylorubrum extorquens]GEL42308.1 hypothetical protein MEX01_28990 [Methylorubrum extorquens]
MTSLQQGANGAAIAWLTKRLKAARSDSEAHPEGHSNRTFYAGQAIAYENVLSLLESEDRTSPRTDGAGAAAGQAAYEAFWPEKGRIPWDCASKESQAPWERAAAAVLASPAPAAGQAGAVPDSLRNFAAEDLARIRAVIPASLLFEVPDLAEAVASTFREYVKVAAEATALRKQVADLRAALGEPFLTAHSGDEGGSFVRLKYAALSETQAAHNALVGFLASHPAGQSTGPGTGERERHLEEQLREGLAFIEMEDEAQKPGSDLYTWVKVTEQLLSEGKPAPSSPRMGQEGTEACTCPSEPHFDGTPCMECPTWEEPTDETRSQAGRVTILPIALWRALDAEAEIWSQDTDVAGWIAKMSTDGRSREKLDAIVQLCFEEGFYRGAVAARNGRSISDSIEDANERALAARPAVPEAQGAEWPVEDSVAAGALPSVAATLKRLDLLHRNAQDRDLVWLRNTASYATTWLQHFATASSGQGGR